MASEPFMKSLLYAKEIQNKYKLDLKLAIEIALGILLIILISSSDILLIFGDSYTLGSKTLITLSVGYVLFIMLGSPIEILNMNGFTKITSIILVFSFIFNVVLNYFLIQIYGIFGAGISTSLSLLISKTLALVFLKKKINLSFIYNLINIRAYGAFGVSFLIYNITFEGFKLIFFDVVITSFATCKVSSFKLNFSNTLSGISS